MGTAPSLQQGFAKWTSSFDYLRKLFCAMLLEEGLDKVIARHKRLAAAKRALSILEGMDFDEFRGRYGCDCVVDNDTSHLQEAVGPAI